MKWSKIVIRWALFVNIGNDWVTRSTKTGHGDLYFPSSIFVTARLLTINLHPWSEAPHQRVDRTVSSLVYDITGLKSAFIYFTMYTSLFFCLTKCSPLKCSELVQCVTSIKATVEGDQKLFSLVYIVPWRVILGLCLWPHVLEL